MKIYDCFMFFDEDMLLDLRLNIMDKYVDKFIITEATYMHNGSEKKLNFDINKFKKFKDKITYIVVDKPPPGLLLLNENDTEESKENKLILNGYKRDNFQREKAMSALDDIHENDWIITSCTAFSSVRGANILESIIFGGGFDFPKAQEAKLFQRITLSILAVPLS